MYATTSGQGGIIPIQVYKNFIGSDGKPVLKITGRQGSVMKESVAIAYNHAMNIIRDDIRDEFQKLFAYGIHIHTPDGATPKEGPSAGCAFGTAFVSRILGIPVKNDIAMTGELDISGNVKKIGGLQYKLTGAKKAGVKLVLVSKQNEEDLQDIIKENPELINDEFKVELVENLYDAVNYSLVDYDEDLLVRI